jgi:Methyltransferase domain
MDSKECEFRLYPARRPDKPLDPVRVRRSSNSLHPLLSEVALEVTNGNIGVTALSHFFAKVLPPCVHNAKFRDIFGFGNAMAFTLRQRISISLFPIRSPCPKLYGIGRSGFSSLVTGEAIAKNKNSALIYIEPFPQEFIKQSFPGSHSLVQKKVEDIDLGFFSQLGTGDILFIDSSHPGKIGGDVNYLFLEILPRLKPGVIVRIHDIFLPFDYRRDWIMEQFRFWSEQYLLHTFLTLNSEFEVQMANSYLNHYHQEELKVTFPTLPCWRGGSFWIRRTCEVK